MGRLQAPTGQGPLRVVVGGARRATLHEETGRPTRPGRRTVEAGPVVGVDLLVVHPTSTHPRSTHTPQKRRRRGRVSSRYGRGGRRTETPRPSYIIFWASNTSCTFVDYCTYATRNSNVSGSTCGRGTGWCSTRPTRSDPTCAPLPTPTCHDTHVSLRSEKTLEVPPESPLETGGFGSEVGPRWSQNSLLVLLPCDTRLSVHFNTRRSCRTTPTPYLTTGPHRHPVPVNQS